MLLALLKTLTKKRKNHSPICFSQKFISSSASRLGQTPVPQKLDFRKGKRTHRRHGPKCQRLKAQSKIGAGTGCGCRDLGGMCRSAHRLSAARRCCTTTLGKGSQRSSLQWLLFFFLSRGLNFCASAEASANLCAHLHGPHPPCLSEGVSLLLQTCKKKLRVRRKNFLCSLTMHRS